MHDPKKFQAELEKTPWKYVPPACHCTACRVAAGDPFPFFKAATSSKDRGSQLAMRKNAAGMWEAVSMEKVEAAQLRRMKLSCPTCQRVFGEVLVTIHAPPPTPICLGCIEEGRQPHMAKLLEP